MALESTTPDLLHCRTENNRCQGRHGGISLRPDRKGVVFPAPTSYESPMRGVQEAIGAEAEMECPSAPIVQARELTKIYGNLRAVDAIDLSVSPGEVFGLLGPNGAGKTTTLRMIQCVSPPTSGSLSVFGMDVRDHPAEIKRWLGVVPQETNLDPDFTCRENLLVYARYFDIPAKEAREKTETLLDFMQLSEKADVPIEGLSGGMKRRLILARALVNDPRLLVLDEPTIGLDPQARHLMWEKLKALQSLGNTILLTTHYLEKPRGSAIGWSSWTRGGSWSRADPKTSSVRTQATRSWRPRTARKCSPAYRRWDAGSRSTGTLSRYSPTAPGTWRGVFSRHVMQAGSSSDGEPSRTSSSS